MLRVDLGDDFAERVDPVGPEAEVGIGQCEAAAAQVERLRDCVAVGVVGEDEVGGALGDELEVGLCAARTPCSSASNTARVRSCAQSTSTTGFDSGGDPQSIKRSLRQIARSSQSAAHLVNQLLAMARAEDTEQARRQQDVPIVKLAKEVVRDFVPRAMDKRIDLGYEGADADPATPRLVGQPVLVRELIRNLVDNALQYTPAGGTVTVRVMPDPYGQVIVLQVEDTGPGIPEVEREQVFQPFYRALGTDVDGSGLGLAIVKEIGDKHQATISIAESRSQASGNAETPGALFTVRFPCSPAAA